MIVIAILLLCRFVVSIAASFLRSSFPLLVVHAYLVVSVPHLPIRNEKKPKVYEEVLFGNVRREIRGLYWFSSCVYRVFYCWLFSRLVYNLIFTIMLQVHVLGRLGANAELKGTDGSKFVSFNVAHTEKWTDDNQVVHEDTTWVSCALNGDGGKLLQYLVAGAQVYVVGDASLRVYSSAKDRCMKAGLNLRVRNIELVGGLVDAVPRQLYDADGVVHSVRKAFYISPGEAKLHRLLFSSRGQQFDVDEHGFVFPHQKVNDPQDSAAVE